MQEYLRIKLFRKGNQEVGLLELTKVPKVDTIKVVFQGEEISPDGYSIIGMPLFWGMKLDDILYRLQNADFLVTYDPEDEQSWQICPTAKDVYTFLEDHPLVELVANRMKLRHQKKGKVWLKTQGEDLVVYGRFILQQNCKVCLLEGEAYKDVTLKRCDIFKLENFKVKSIIDIFNVIFADKHISLRDMLRGKFVLNDGGIFSAQPGVKKII